mmetsp:Transcript_49528/g.105225  ORF Transcript_49528/g.105225 Transcript_49528/m.105225 type:complete len:784 (+) Transcript_49528:204-2555(+)|eukprot:CAMPEP_0172559260 /NCGR_PEP_ID=MMETSP1067-20121228/83227_1 /TAXON_ID=265564 ORGANISM="Thalassiosira punctigera, Strain Tpunct2005C2" /NCGR_SAMPLE_ID=MMETSP1067 /ASSEMBLY_ACC=CAM_ASM_000444 /LENGTH=783 /DNA_ID=CAMNT_0013348813 /DNA_START=128 /DNA_END=2479 /DNA_ORIENTATION=+
MADINNDSKSSAVLPLVDLLGPTIISNKEGGEISVADIARTKKTVVLYFSAHWCPPCRGFTPALSEAYAQYKGGKNGQQEEDGDDDAFELVFVSSDSDAESFRDYHLEMTFPALPFESRDVEARLSEKFGVEGIPHLVAVDVSTGEEDSAVMGAVGGDLHSFVALHGAAAFPLTSSHIREMKAEEEKKRVDALAKLAASSIVVSVPPSSDEKTNGHGGDDEKAAVEKIEFGELLERYEHVGIVFGDGDPTDAAYEKIQVAAKAIGEDKFVPLYLGWSEYNGQSDHPALWERFHSVREEGLTNEARSTLSDVAGEKVDYLMMITIKSKGSGLCGMDGKCEASGTPVIVSVDKGLRALRQFGPAAFPWDEAAVNKAQEVKKRRVNGLKERLAEFDFLKTKENDSNDGLLLKGSGDVERKHVLVDNLLSSDEGEDAVLGLYFSAHWCPPCRAFTPELLKNYEEIRTQKGSNSFEVLFVSFDDEEKEFEDYYESMVTPGTKDQWLSLDYKKSRELANDLTEVFGVEGYPSLVLLKRDGTILSNNARSGVSQYGPGSFPWDADAIKRGKDELLKKEEEDVESQRKQGRVVVRRIMGPVGSIKYDSADRLLEFNNSFATAILDETIVTQGVLYYEVEIVEVDGIAQFGFALRNALAKTNEPTGDGVGDDSKSWGVCGIREELWHNGDCIPMEDPSSTWGWEIGDVIGFAVNVDLRKIAISKNGNWSKEAGCGVVFDNLSGAGDDSDIHPGLSAEGLKVRLNVQETDLCFSKPLEEVWEFNSPSEGDTTE